MSKAVMISIQPKWCELIASGRKTVEIRKTRPKLDAPFKCYIYMTAGNASYPVKLCGEPFICHQNGGQVVIGEFVCDGFIPYVNGRPLAECENTKIAIEECACLNATDIRRYEPDGNPIGWQISDLVIYDKPKNLSEFYKNDTLDNDAFLETLYDGYQTYAEYLFTQAVRKPPQSWCYVEELVGGDG